MAAATKNRDAQKSPSDLTAYTVPSGSRIYKDTAVMRSAGGTIMPMVQGAGASGGRFLGIANNEVIVSGTTNAVLQVYTSGIFTLVANGTGSSNDIGQRAYFLDDQTVGTSLGFPTIAAGLIVGLPSTSTYRVMIDEAVGSDFRLGNSGNTFLN